MSRAYLFEKVSRMSAHFFRERLRGDPPLPPRLTQENRPGPPPTRLLKVPHLPSARTGPKQAISIRLTRTLYYYSSSSWHGSWGMGWPRPGPRRSTLGCSALEGVGWGVGGSGWLGGAGAGAGAGVW